MSIDLAFSESVQHPAVPPALALLVGEGIGVRWPGLPAGALLSFVGLTWACTVAACLRGRNGWTTRCALVSFLLVGALLGAQATTHSVTSGLWQWYQHQSPAALERLVLVRDA